MKGVLSLPIGIWREEKERQKVGKKKKKENEIEGSTLSPLFDSYLIEQRGGGYIEREIRKGNPS